MIDRLSILANADNIIVNQETQIITEIMVRESWTENDFEKAMSELSNDGLLVGKNINPQDIKVVRPETFEKSLVYLQDLVALIMVDGEITNIEKEIYMAIAAKMGHSSSVAELMIELVKSKLQKKFDKLTM